MPRKQNKKVTYAPEPCIIGLPVVPIKKEPIPTITPFIVDGIPLPNECNHGIMEEITGPPPFTYQCIDCLKKF